MCFNILKFFLTVVDKNVFFTLSKHFSLKLKDVGNAKENKISTYFKFLTLKLL